MMYNNKLACAIKVNGQVLREFDDTTYLPFGSEYSFFIKNLNTVRVQVSIEVDGDDIADGSTFIIQPGKAIDIERSIRNGNNTAGNKFKFIERTSGVESHRGIGAEDGLIRITYKFEKPVPVFDPIPPYFTTDITYNVRDGGNTLPGRGNNILRSTNMVTRSVDSAVLSNASVETSDFEFTEQGMFDVSDAGITVEGAVSSQQFQTADDFPLETVEHVMVLKLLGETENNRPIKRPITVREKPSCISCGVVAPSFKSQFCGDCGTSLVIV